MDSTRDFHETKTNECTLQQIAEQSDEDALSNDERAFVEKQKTIIKHMFLFPNKIPRLIKKPECFQQSSENIRRCENQLTQANMSSLVSDKNDNDVLNVIIEKNENMFSNSSEGELNNDPIQSNTSKCENSTSSSNTFSAKFLPRRKSNTKLKELKTKSTEHILGKDENSIDSAQSQFMQNRKLETFNGLNDKRKFKNFNTELRRKSDVESSLITEETKGEIREREAWKRTSDISQMLTSEKRLTSLKEENHMKKKLDDVRIGGDGVKIWRKKNADVCNSTMKKLEDQAVNSNAAMKRTSPLLPNTNQLKTSQFPINQKHKTTTDFSLAKEAAIQLLQSKYQQLIFHLNSINAEQAMELTKTEGQLENIIKCSAKEKLQLEKDIVSEKRSVELESSMKRCQLLEEQVAVLEKELNNLQVHVDGKEKLEVEIVEKCIAMEGMEKKLELLKSKILKLEEELTSLRDVNMQMTISNTDLQKQLDHSREKEKDYVVMKRSLQKTENELRTAKEKITSLESSVRFMTTQIEELMESEDKTRSLEIELKKLKDELKEKDAVIQSLNKSHQKKVNELQMDNDDMKNKLDLLQNEKSTLAEENQKLLEELERLKVVKKDLDAHVVKGLISSDEEVKHETHHFTNHTDLGITNNKSPNSTNEDKEESSANESIKDIESSSMDQNEVQIFKALYNYDPHHYSPNERPNEELSFTTGDFLIVYGGMDEDGFYYGESMEGQKGVIPSNFVRKLSENEKSEFYKMVNMDIMENTTSNLLIQNDESVMVSTFNGKSNGLMSDEVYSNDVLCPGSSHPAKAIAALPEPPISIHVELGFNFKSLLVSWLPVTITPHGMSNGVQVDGYAVCVDGRKVKIVENPTDDQVELDEDDLNQLNEQQPRYITVRTLASNGSESHDSVPFFLSQNLISTLVPDRLTNGYLEGKEDEMKNGSFQSLLRDKDANMTDRSWKNLPLRQSLDFQTTQQFQALYRSASVNDAQPMLHETFKFNSDSGLVDSKVEQLYDQTSRSLDVNLCNGHEVLHRDDVDHHPYEDGNHYHYPYEDGDDDDDDNDNHHHHRQSLGENFNSGSCNGGSKQLIDQFNSKIEACRRKIFPEVNDYKSIVLTDNDILTSANIRDDIPYSELIDYEDDAGESLSDDVVANGVEGEGEAVRIFIALFSYDPVTMSPNPDAIDVELKFREGQIIKIFGSEDEDGFYIGEAGGRRGLVPRNMVSEVEVDDPDVADELLKESSRQVMQSVLGMNSDASSRAPSTQEDANVHEGSDQEVRYMVAIYDYNPLELSPNTDVEQELSFNKGDIIEIYGEADSDGFFYGTLNNISGLVPSNFITDLHNHTLI